MHRDGKITPHNISSHVVPEIARHLYEFYGTSYPRKTIRAKYYALKTWLSFISHLRGKALVLAGILINSPLSWMLAGGRSCCRNYWKFKDKSCFIYHILEEVFATQGASGEFSSGLELSPCNSDKELLMENSARPSRGKGRVESDPSDEDAQLVGQKKRKCKKAKGKQKSGDMSSDIPFPGASPLQPQRYNWLLDSIETLVS